MLRTTNPQASLWEAILPAEVLGLPAELTMVDRLLDDPVFIQPFRAHFDPKYGRPSIPIDTYLRLMFLKHRYGLGYELLCHEVADSISWQRFCRIPLGSRVPHPTTLVKLTRRMGEHTVAELNQALLYRAAEGKLLRTHKLRADTTVVAANVAYPTDLGLLARAVDKLATTAKRVQAAGGATRTRVRDRRRAAHRRARKVARAMRSRTDQAKQVVFEVTGQVAGLAEAQLADARRVVAGARRALARGRTQPAGRLRAVVQELQTTIQRTRRLLDQAHIRLGGGMPDGASRLVSLHDPDARPIRKGRLGRPVESEDRSAVIAAVRGVGLDGHANTSYPRGLAALLDAPPLRYAVIDVGTNSVKFHIGERDAAGRWRAVADRAELTRLGEHLQQTGTISPEPLERTVTAIAGMVEEARRHQVRATAAVGTAGLRIASNRDDVIAAIRERTGLTVEVIPGEEESRLAYLAVRAGLGVTEGSLAVFDTGGGSTEFTFGRGPQVEDRFSLEVGAVPYTERYGLAGPVAPEVLDDAMAAIAADLARLDGRPPPAALVGMGGAVTNITAVKLGLAVYDPDAVQGAVLDRAEIDRQIERYRSRDAEARRAIVGLQPKRADVILAGACIVRTVMDKLGQQTLTVSDRGLRHGLLVDRFGG